MFKTWTELADWKRQLLLDQITSLEKEGKRLKVDINATQMITLPYKQMMRKTFNDRLYQSKKMDYRELEITASGDCGADEVSEDESTDVEYADRGMALTMERWVWNQLSTIMCVQCGQPLTIGRVMAIQGTQAAIRPMHVQCKLNLGGRSTDSTEDKNQKRYPQALIADSHKTQKSISLD